MVVNSQSCNNLNKSELDYVKGKAKKFELNIIKLLSDMRAVIMRAENEKDIKDIFLTGAIYENLLKPLGLSCFEIDKYLVISNDNKESLYNEIVILCKSPGKLASIYNIEKSKKEIIEYITKKEKNKNLYDKYLGIILCDRIAFITYNKNLDKWVLYGPYAIDIISFVKLIGSIRGLKRKAIKSEYLIRDFGFDSELSKDFISILYKKLINSEREETKIFFEEWANIYKEIYNVGLFEDIGELAYNYGIFDNIDGDALFYAIQTYYSIILKLLAAEAIFTYMGDNKYGSFLIKLYNEYIEHGVERLKENLNNIENSTFFEKMGYKNYLNLINYFSWYIYEIDKDLENVIIRLIEKLLEYEITTIQMDLNYDGTALEKLYYNLIQGNIRYRLGKYYSIIEVIDNILNDLGLSYDNLEKMIYNYTMYDFTVEKLYKIKILDSNSGPGIFLVRCILRFKELANMLSIPLYQRDITENIIGYELNPLALIVSRTNYLFAIVDLPRDSITEIPIYLTNIDMVKKEIEIPIYLTKVDLFKKENLNNIYFIKVNDAILKLSKSLLSKSKLLSILEHIETAIRYNYPIDKFRNFIIEKTNALSNEDIDILVSFYSNLLEIKNSLDSDIVASIIRFAFKTDRFINIDSDAYPYYSILYYIILNLFAPVYNENVNYIIRNGYILYNNNNYIIRDGYIIYKNNTKFLTS
ncbi:MAG: hypothetical protein QXW35_03805 [Candidatus Aenigmatarchaeota archaeon]